MDIIKVILTSILSAAALFIIAKILGHKQKLRVTYFKNITNPNVSPIGKTFGFNTLSALFIKESGKTEDFI